MGDKIKGITGKLILITFAMFMVFFVIIMVIQLFISGYALIDDTRRNLSGKKELAVEYINYENSEDDLKVVDEYSYVNKSFLHALRKRISDDNAVCEFLIIDTNGNICCALRNEIAVYTMNGNIKFAQFENASPADFREIIEGVNKELSGGYPKILPKFSFMGEGIGESVIEYVYYAVDAYSFRSDGKIYYDRTDKVKLQKPDIELRELSGAYAYEFISGKENSHQYLSNMNENRLKLIEAVTNNAYDNENEGQSIFNAFFYDTLKINDEYTLVMRTQIKPVQAVLMSSLNTYIALTFLTLIFSIILALIFSRMLVKPVRRIEEKARRLAILDFSDNGDYQYSREDEIGSLYKSINSLAVNLNNAITELQTENQELAEDIEKERKLDARRREFVAATSHELKTPLARIRGYSEALNMNLSEDKKNYYCESLMLEVDMMNSLILEMLSLSKLESQNYDNLDISDIDLVDIVDDVVSRCKKSIDDKNISMNIFADMENIMCKGDKAKIERVITNFVDNAIHYTPDGKKIYIRLSVRNGKGYFEIENEGKHIDVAMMPYIWESFYKENKARTKDKKLVTAERTGLGLSIVRAILNLHKAEYGVNNTETGVLFYFYLDN